MTRRSIPALLSLPLAWAFLSAAPVAAQAPGSAPAQPARGGMAMMAARADEMAAADKRLDELMRALQSATGAAKVDSLAAVVAELVAQHKAMHGRMARMGEMMSPAASAPGADHQASPGSSADPHKH